MIIINNTNIDIFYRLIENINSDGWVYQIRYYCLTDLNSLVHNNYDLEAPFVHYSFYLLLI